MAFWKKRRDTVTPEEHVQIALGEGERLVGERPKAALKALGRLGETAYPLVTFGGEYHERFQSIVRKALGRESPAPAVRSCPWSHWQTPFTMADVLTLAQEVPVPVLYFHEPTGNFARRPVVEIEGLEALAKDDRLVMVVIGESSALVKRDLLIEVAGAADLTCEEILQEIVDAARKSGFRVLSIIG